MNCSHASQYWSYLKTNFKNCACIGTVFFYNALSTTRKSLAHKLSYTWNYYFSHSQITLLPLKYVERKKNLIKLRILNSVCIGLNYMLCIDADQIRLGCRGVLRIYQSPWDKELLICVKFKALKIMLWDFKVDLMGHFLSIQLSQVQYLPHDPWAWRHQSQIHFGRDYKIFIHYVRNC